METKIFTNEFVTLKKFYRAAQARLDQKSLTINSDHVVEKEPRNYSSHISKFENAEIALRLWRGLPRRSSARSFSLRVL